MQEALLRFPFQWNCYCWDTVHQGFAVIPYRSPPNSTGVFTIPMELPGWEQFPVPQGQSPMQQDAGSPVFVQDVGKTEDWDARD